MDRHQFGRDAEALAAERLLANGFEILWRNLRIGAFEIDLVAKKGDLVVVVEVRAREARSRSSRRSRASHARSASRCCVRCGASG